MPTVHTWQYLEYIVEGEGDDQYITIYGYDSAENPEHPHVHIPAEIDHEGTDLPVKRIGVSDPDPETMEGAPFPYAGIEGVTIEEGIEIVGTGAFFDNDLGDVDFPSTLKKLETQAFTDAGITGEVNLEGLEEINGEAVLRDNAITAVTLGENLNIIDETFMLKNNLTELTIPNNVTEIKYRAFNDNDLKEVHFGESVTDIRDGAFRTNDITKIIIPADVTIEGSAFRNNQKSDDDKEFKDIYEAGGSEAGTYEWNETDEEWEKTGDYESPEEPEPPEVGVVGGYGGIRVGYRGLFGY